MWIHHPDGQLGPNRACWSCARPPPRTAGGASGGRGEAGRRTAAFARRHATGFRARAAFVWCGAVATDRILTTGRKSRCARGPVGNRVALEPGRKTGMPRGCYDRGVSDQRWPVPAEETGLRLDKFLAAPDRLASRSRAIAAIERGKIFLNDVEATPADAARRLVAGEVLRFWD